MGVCCCICGSEKFAGSSLSFHRIPKDPDLRLKWIEVIGRDINYDARVCSKHFQITDFLDSSLVKRTLLRTAIPIKSTSINNTVVIDIPRAVDSSSFNKVSTECPSETYSVELLDEHVNHNNSSVFNAESLDIEYPNQLDQEQINVQLDHQNVNNANVNRVTLKRKNESPISDDVEKKSIRLELPNKGTGSLCREDFTSDRAWSLFVNSIVHQRKQHKVTKQKVSRLTNKIDNLNSLLESLKDKKLLSTSAADSIEDTVPPHLRSILELMINKKHNMKYPEELSSFAATLHYHSPAEYRYVRSSLLKCLPHESTLRKWMRNVDMEPGICEKAIKQVRLEIEERKKKGESMIFNLTFDEMAIRKKVEMVGGKMVGFVDLGNKSINDTEATQVLVYMLVSVNGHYKVPIAYYFINSLTADEKKTILLEILTVLHEESIEVVGITFDGAASNISMCNKLGAKLKHCDVDDLKPYFEHPVNKKNIYIMYDPCHALKLVRNQFASLRVIEDNEGNKIKWEYIERLEKLQELTGLHAATKLRRRHVHFQNEKMKVNLAAQLLSNSVADALLHAKDHCDIIEKDFGINFSEVEATAKFCKIFNDVFDLLNSKNLYNKNPTKCSVNNSNIKDVSRRVAEYVKYISTLKINGIPIIETNSRTGFIGLIICLKNTIAMFETLFAENKIKFLMTYKLSQDHIETFFSLIRRRGGWNNNPSVREFQAAYKQILYVAEVAVPHTANCLPKDDTVLLQVSKSNVKEKLYFNDMSPKKDMFDFSIFDHDYTNNCCWRLSEYTLDIIKYIAGFIVKSISDKMSCVTCKRKLQSNDSSDSCQLLLRKNWFSKLDCSKNDKPNCTDKSLTLHENNESWSSNYEKLKGLTEASHDVVEICSVAEQMLRQHQSLIFTQKRIIDYLSCKCLRYIPTTIFEDHDHMFDQSILFDHRYQVIKLILKKFFTIRLHHELKKREEDTVRLRMRNNKITLLKNL